MPDYTTVDECLVTLPAMGSVTTVVSADIARFIDQMEAVVNAKISRLYSVPVAGTPPLLRVITTDGAIYRMMTRRLFAQEKVNNSAWPDRYKEALDLLNQVATGEIPLLTNSGDVIDTTDTGAPMWSNNQGYTPTFNEDEGIYHNIDPEKLDDIEGQR